VAKYTKDVLTAAAAESLSIAGVLRRLGLRFSGGSHAHISRRMKMYGIDTSHFTGSAHARGKASFNKVPAAALLVAESRTGRRVAGHRLRRALRELGVPEECVECGIGTSWRGKPITLHVDHIDGNYLDNRPENLRILCPNCHSQTPTYAGAWKNRRSGSPICGEPPVESPVPDDGQ